MRPKLLDEMLSTHAYGPDALDDHVCDCGHPWGDHDLTRGCLLLACTCAPPDGPAEVA